MEKPEIPVLVFIAGLLFFGWPLMEVTRALSPGGRLLYFFGLWVIVVVINIVIFRRVR